MQKTRINSVISRNITMEYVDAEGAPTDIETEFQYHPADPFAVSVVFRSGDVPVTWTFSRDLLIDGLYEPVGTCDVQVWPCLSSQGSAVVILELLAPAGEVMVQAPSRRVHDFVTRMMDTVPQGAELEVVDFDDELYALLAS